MNLILSLLIFLHKAKLSKMINKNLTYEKVLKESQKLDKLIIIQMKKINQIRS